MLELNGGRRSRLGLAIAVLGGCSGGCSGGPAHDILGSYFPSWMICALLGLLFALVVRRILTAAAALAFATGSITSGGGPE
jgi:YtcA family